MYKAIIVALAAVAAAVPTWPQHGGNTEVNNEVGNVCGNGNSVHCCNSETAGKLTGGGILGGLDLSDLLGQCNDVTATVIGAAVPIKNTCTEQTVCCNKSEQNGLVNVGCTNLNL